jgi:hypothetical protein
MKKSIIIVAVGLAVLGILFVILKKKPCSCKNDSNVNGSDTDLDTVSTGTNQLGTNVRTNLQLLNAITYGNSEAVANS